MGALAIDYLGVLIGRMRGFRVSPIHFAERHHLIVIIALGESIVAIGIGAAGLPLAADVVMAAVLGMAVIAALWWAYFDVYAIAAQRHLAQVQGVARATLGRDYYSYLHLPMIGGIVLFALGLKKTLEHVGDPLATVPAAALCGGLALYFATHVAMRIRLVLDIRQTTSDRPGLIGPGRTTAGLACLVLLPVAMEMSALVALALLAGVCCSLIIYDVIHYREDRDRVRHESWMPGEPAR
jgi:low temperature requirement protein LtrA